MTDWGPCPRLYLVFIGTGLFSVVGWKSLLLSLSPVPKEAISSFCLTPTPYPCVHSLSGRKGSRVPGNSFCLAPCGYKFPVTALALLVPVPSGVPTTQGLKPKEPHSLAGSLALIKAFSA